MGLLEILLGKENPATQWASQNQNFLGAIGAGLGQGQNLQSGLSAGLAQVPQAKALDYQAAEKAKADAKVVAQTNATKQWLAQNYPDLAQAVDAGLPVSEAWQEAFNRKNAKAAAPQNPYMNAGDGQFFNWQTGQFITNPNAAAGTADAPTVQTRFNPETGREEKVTWNPQTQTWDPFGGQKAVNSSGDLSATETRQLFETEDAIAAGQNVVSALDTALSLNDRARSGWGAELSANVGANLPDWVPLIGGNSSDADTLQLKNIVTEQALSQLKLVFGGNPTEGERQILLDIQGSVNQPADVRKRIFDRAKELALTRIKFNEQRKAKIEGGGYGVVNGGTRTGGNYTVVKVE